jgi:hypothetical protein
LVPAFLLYSRTEQNMLANEVSEQPVAGAGKSPDDFKLAQVGAVGAPVGATHDAVMLKPFSEDGHGSSELFSRLNYRAFSLLTCRSHLQLDKV